MTKRNKPRARQPTDRPKALILDVYFAYVSRLGGWLAVSDLVSLMHRLRVDEQAVRSAVSRMTRQNMLVPERRGTIAGYRLSDEARDVMAKFNRRLLSPQKAAEFGDGWVLVLYSIPEREREKRHLLRTWLTWLGFGNISSGVWIAPKRALDDIRETVARLGFEPYVAVFEGQYRGFDSMIDVARQAWDLESMNTQYVRFLKGCDPILRRWTRRDPNHDREQAFVDYTLTLNRWRKLPFIDPGLPSDLLPGDWQGGAAATAFSVMRERLEKPADQYVERAAINTVRALGVR